MSLLNRVPKINFLGQKMHFLGLGKRPKTNIKSEVQSNLNKKKLTLGMFATNHVSLFFFNKNTKKFGKVTGKWLNVILELFDFYTLVIINS